MKFTNIRLFGRLAHAIAVLGFASAFMLPGLVSAQGYQISTGDDFGAIIDPSGKLYLWGAIQSNPGGVTEVLPSEGWESVAVSKTAAAEAHILAIREDGTLWAWGKNDRGQVGNNTRDDQVSPVKIGSATNWVEVAAGKSFSLGRRANNDVYVWGDNSFGQLVDRDVFNDPNLDLRLRPEFPLADRYIAISAGNAHVHGIRENGTLWAWGSGGAESDGGYELGLGSLQIGYKLPTQVGTFNNWTDLFGGYNATFATRGSGELYVWGTGANLGTGAVVVASPARVGSASNWVSVSQSRNHTIALQSNGSLWGWGDTSDGALGVTPQLPFSTPRQLEAPNTFQAIGAGESFSVVIDADGFMLSTGLNTAGQLANGSTTGLGQPFFDNSDFGFADIFATALTFTSATPAPGSTITGSLSLTNAGTGTLEQAFKLAAFYSSTTSLFDGQPLNFAGGSSELTVSDSILPGGVLNVPISLEIPDSVPQGNYYIILKADAGGNSFFGEIQETNEINNEVASDISFEFFPDLVFDAGNGIVLNPVLGNYLPNVSTLEMTINLQNTGAGTIPSDTSFDLRVFLSPTKNVNDSSAVDLDSELVVTLTSDLVPGASDTIVVNYDVVLPIGLATGSYYIGAVLDVKNDITEQTELLSDTSIVLRQDGEDNNIYFTPDSLVNITGIPIDVAIDEAGRSFTTSGDADWFGQEQIFNVGGHSVQSPSIGAGESAAFSTTFADPVVVTFDWRSQTSSAQNKLIYRVVGGVTGVGNNEISGNTEWLSEQRVVPAGAQVEWVYSETDDAASDAVYVDNLEAFQVTEPELVVDSINLTQNGSIVESGTYVLKRDQLNININSRNQGTATGALDDFVVSVYLSADRELNRPDNDADTLDDVLLRQVAITDIVGAGDLPLNGLAIDLPTNIRAGNYYLIAYIDDYTDANGNLLPGATSGTGFVDEFTTNGFPGETNNQFVTIDPIIEVVALPDLVVTQVNPQPGYYLVRELNPDTNQFEPNVLDFDFSIANEGLAPVNDPIRIKILFSRDENMDPNSDYVVLDYEYTGGLAAEGSSASTKNINPGAVDIREDLISLGYIGERLYFGVFIDSEGVVEELNESNNGINYIDNGFIFSEVTVGQAFEFDDGAGNEVTQDEIPSFDGELPWVGQTSTTVDGIDAAMSVDIGNNGVSAFETLIDAGSVPTFVSFRWRVSSQNDVLGRDSLNFYIDDFDNPVASIAGTEDGWTRISRLLSPGEHRLRWEYRKDGIISAGEDRGWVDDFSFRLPNLIVTQVEVDDSLAYSAGDSIDEWSVTIQNSGLAGVPPTPAFDVELGISTDNTWGGDDYTLITLTDNEGLAVGETRTYSHLTHGSLVIPSEISLDANYYVGAFVDLNSSIPESDEGDNDFFTESASLAVSPSILLNVGIDDPIGINDLEVGGTGDAGGWFGVADSQIPGGASDGVDAVQSGATGIGESSYLQTLMEGPWILSFDWKVSSRPGSNILEFSINDVVQPNGSISGEVDWESKSYFIPAGTQEIRWTYRKTGDVGESSDAAWLDNVTLSEVTEPELALTALNYTPGRYVLDVAGFVGAPDLLVGTEYLDISVDAENQGYELASGTNFTVADLEVRLSTDRTYGNGDDIVLGTVSQVEGTLEPGDLMRFLGPIQLGDSIPAGFYYLIARVDANEEIAEFDEDNNIIISQARDVEIARLPALRIANPMSDPINGVPSVGQTDEGPDIVNGNFYLDPRNGSAVAFDIDEGLIYYAEGPMRLRFDIQNIGLGRVEGSAIWTTEINLRGLKREDITNDPQDIIDAVEPSINLGSFTIQELLEGRSAAKPEGDSVEIDIDLALPNAARLNDVIDDEFFISEYLWFIEVILDSTNVIEQSEIVRESPGSGLIAPTGLSWWIVNLGELAADVFDGDPSPYSDIIESSAFNTDSADGFFGIAVGVGPTTAAAWEAIYSAYPITVPANFLAYAFNRNPADGDTVGPDGPEPVNTFGITAFEGEDVMSIAFDIVTRSTDLVYIVEAADNPSFTSPDPIVEIQGPFDELVGSRSLTGDGGLIDEAHVTSVLDQGYSARITIKDTQVITPSSPRYIRVRAVAASASPSPLMSAAVIVSSSILSTDIIWEPEGWVYYEWPYVYSMSGDRWHYFDISDEQWRVNLINAQWGTLADATGWHYYQWPYSYSIDQSIWYWYNDDTQWVVDLVTGIWARFDKLENSIWIESGTAN